MKNIKIIIASVIVILIIIAIVFFINNSSQGKTEKINEKVISEVKYLERYIVDSLNKIQNIDLNKSNIEEGEIDWEYLKKETSNIYTSIPTITLDLYSTGVEQDKILSFNKDLDLIMNSINKKEKIETAKSLAKLYSYLPDYMEKLDGNTRETNILRTKSNLFNAYSLLDSDKWEEVSAYIKLSLENFAVVIGNSKDKSSSYIENKCFIELNELVNSVNEKDKQTFLIKYKNLVEDLENL